MSTYKLSSPTQDFAPSRAQPLERVLDAPKQGDPREDQSLSTLADKISEPRQEICRAPSFQHEGYT